MFPLVEYRKMSLDSASSIAGLQGIHQKQEIFIVGSGSSIKATSLRMLEGEVVIFLNNAVSLRKAINPSMGYFVVSDHLKRVDYDLSCFTVRILD